MESKKWYASKTIWVQIIAGVALIVGVFVPSAGLFLQQHFAEAGLGWGVINIILRATVKHELSK